MAVYRSRLFVLPLFTRLRIVTSGNAWNAPEYVEIDVPDLTNLLPQAEALTLITLNENPTTQLRWGVFFYSGFDAQHQNGPFQIGGDVSASGSLRHATPYTTLDNFLLDSRIVVGMGNNSGTLRECATASAALLVKTVGM